MPIIRRNKIYILFFLEICLRICTTCFVYKIFFLKICFNFVINIVFSFGYAIKFCTKLFSHKPVTLNLCCKISFTFNKIDTILYALLKKINKHLWNILQQEVQQNKEHRNFLPRFQRVKVQLLPFFVIMGFFSVL